MAEQKQEQRSPLTGTLFIEFVDGADPDDADTPPNFGMFQSRFDPESWRSDSRLPLLLRWLADHFEEDQREMQAWNEQE